MATMVVGCLPGLILLFCCCFKCTSDYDAISMIFDVHKYAKTPKDAVAEVVTKTFA
ncbi:hypothetical protein Hanom_Chr09g00836351 [Helianthus anomalus]